MRQQVILCDVGGYRKRLSSMRNAHPDVVGVRPSDLPPVGGFRQITIPDEWLPQNLEFQLGDPMDPYSRRCWFACGKLGLAAYRELDIRADFTWFFESDLAGTPTVIRAMIDAHSANSEDCVVVTKMTRASHPGNQFWNHPGTPAWIDLQHIGCLYRLSRAAVQVCLDTAEEYREVFGELSIAAVVEKHGGTVGTINRVGLPSFTNNQTIKADATRVKINARMLNHPLKFDSYGPLD